MEESEKETKNGSLLESDQKQQQISELKRVCRGKWGDYKIKDVTVCVCVCLRWVCVCLWKLMWCVKLLRFGRSEN